MLLKEYNMTIKPTSYVKSPLNYIGGKFKLLDQILPLLPNDINTFVDVFAGGCNVGINVKCNNLHINDRITALVSLYRYFQTTDIDDIIKGINDRIIKFGLSKTNESGYKKLLETYNIIHNPLDMFVVSCYSFNHQIRFNNKFKMNISFGKNRSQYNANIEHNLVNFCNAIQQRSVKFTSLDFRELNFSNLDGNDFVYCDPPYSLSNGSYNDGNRGYGDWCVSDDIALLQLLDNLDKSGIRFALTNVIEHKGRANTLLLKWSQKYIMHKIHSTYTNCNYHLINKDTSTQEVLICNYSL